MELPVALCAKIGIRKADGTYYVAHTTEASTRLQMSCGDEITDVEAFLDACGVPTLTDVAREAEDA